MSDAILVVNAGSTSVKFAAYAMNTAGSLPVLCRGQVDSMQSDPHFVVKNEAGKPLATHEWGDSHTIDHKTALHFVITWLEANLADMKVAAAGHRVVLGGSRFEAPTRIDGDVLDYLASLAVMEPSHQTFNVRGAQALAEAFPGLPQVACFDSSFHRTMPEVAQIYALPRDVRDAGVRHWGNHGISDPSAVAAMEYFVYAMTKYAGAYAAVLGGLDAFVFTAGIGEHSAPVRAALCSKLAWLGLKLDALANASDGPRISTPDSRVSVWIIPTDEELMIAQHTLALFRK